MPEGILRIMSLRLRLPVWAAVAGLLPAIMSGCMVNRTRDLPDTALRPNKYLLPSFLKGKAVKVDLEYRFATVSGGHHEGPMQMRQPWFLGISKQQRSRLYESAGKVAGLAFILELKMQGLDVNPKKPDYLLTGNVGKVDLNTYGRGTTDGHGSAGNYWESTVRYSRMSFRDAKTDRILWEGSLTSYAKLSPSPVKLDLDMFTVVSKTLTGAIYLSSAMTTGLSLATISAAKSYLLDYDANYRVNSSKFTPIEIAGRQAAGTFLEKLK